MENTLTEQDLNDLQYFWQEKEDLERLSTFERLIPILEKEKPEVLKAWNDYKTSKKILDIVMDNICQYYTQLVTAKVSASKEKINF